MRRNFLLPLLVAAGLTGCASSATLSAPAAAPVEALAIETPQSLERQAIRRAFLRLTIVDPEAALPQVESVTENAGGYVEASSKGERHIGLSLRIPAPELDPFLERVQSLGETDELRVSSTDVTDAVADLDARIANLTAVRDRLRSHLDRATEIADIIAVERELVRVQTELEILEGRRQRLTTDVAFSTVDLRMERKRVLGPLGLLGAGVGWVVTRLIFIR